MPLADGLDRARAALKLLPNLVLTGPAGDDEADDDDADAAVEDSELDDELGEELSAPLVASVLGEPPVVVDVDEGSLRRPAKSCLLDLRVVELVGRRLVVLVFGAGVVVLLVVVLLPLALVALSRVWNLLFLLPNLRLPEAPDSVAPGSPAVGLVAAGWLLEGNSLAGDVTEEPPWLSATLDDADVVVVVDDDDVEEDTETLIVGGLTELVAAGLWLIGENVRLTETLGNVVCGKEEAVCWAAVVVELPCCVEAVETATGGVGDETGLLETGWLGRVTGGARVKPLPVLPSGVAGLPLPAELLAPVGVCRFANLEAPANSSAGCLNSGNTWRLGASGTTGAGCCCCCTLGLNAR